MTPAAMGRGTGSRQRAIRTPRIGATHQDVDSGSDPDGERVVDLPGEILGRGIHVVERRDLVEVAVVVCFEYGADV